MLKTIPDIINELKQTTRLITAQVAAKEMISNKGLLIDVREPQECLTLTATDAVNIPRGLLEMKVLALEANPERPIYLHCASGVRAIFAAEQLGRVGYENVTVITCPVPEIANHHYTSCT